MLCLIWSVNCLSSQNNLTLITLFYILPEKCDILPRYRPYVTYYLQRRRCNWSLQRARSNTFGIIIFFVPMRTINWPTDWRTCALICFCLISPLCAPVLHVHSLICCSLLYHCADVALNYCLYILQLLLVVPVYFQHANVI